MSSKPILWSKYLWNLFCSEEFRDKWFAFKCISRSISDCITKRVQNINASICPLDRWWLSTGIKFCFNNFLTISSINKNRIWLKTWKFSQQNQKNIQKQGIKLKIRVIEKLLKVWEKWRCFQYFSFWSQIRQKARTELLIKIFW